MKAVALIVASGTGQRMGGHVPKQFLPLAGVPVVARTLRVFGESGAFVGLVVARNPEHAPYWAALRQGPLADLPFVETAGGPTRTASVLQGLRTIEEAFPGAGIVSITDGVRPFVTQAMIAASIAAAQATGSGVCAVPVKSSLREKTPTGSQAVDRSRFFHVQTPQSFRFAPLLVAYEKLAHQSFTDDASLFEAAGHPVTLVNGSYDNLKITTPEDLLIGASILKRLA